MTLTQLSHLRAVVRYGNISQAAAALYISQPALSKSINLLEREFGVSLLNKNARPIQLTRAGQLFFERSEQILNLAEDLRHEMQDISQNLHTTITMGIPGEKGSVWLPYLLPLIQKEYPQLDLHVKEGNSRQLEDMLAHEEIDICLYTSPIYNSEIDYLAFAREPIVFAAAKSHPLSQSIDLARNSPYTPTLLSSSLIINEKFLILAKGGGMNRIAHSIFERHRIHPRIVMELHRHETCVRLAAEGLGLVVTPIKTPLRLGIEDQLLYFTLDDPVICRDHVLAYKRGKILSPEAQKLIQLTSTLTQRVPDLVPSIREILTPPPPYYIQTPSAPHNCR